MIFVIIKYDFPCNNCNDNSPGPPRLTRFTPTSKSPTKSNPKFVYFVDKNITDFISLTEEEKKIVIQLISSETKDQVKSSKSEVDRLKKELNSKRPISKATLKSLKETINLEWTYNSNGIEGNTLTLRETQVVLEGITVGGKSITEHLEAINHDWNAKYFNSWLF